jgi:chaperone BCS1
MIKNNPVFAGLFSMWGITIAGFVFRKVPASLSRMIFERITVSLPLNSSEWREDQVIECLNRYLEKKPKIFRTNKNQVLTNSVDASEKIAIRRNMTYLAPGEGRAWFFHKGHLFFRDFQRQEKANGGSNVNLYTKVIIRCFSFNQKHMKQFVLDISEHLREKKDARLFMQVGSNDRVFDINRPLDSVFTEGHLKEDLVKQIQNFYDKENYNKRKGLNHKFVILLYGGYGLGKTSLIQAIATYFRANVKIMSIQDHVDNFYKAFADVEEPAFIVIEDFDDSDKMKNRFAHGDPYAQKEEPGIEPLQVAQNTVQKTEDKSTIAGIRPMFGIGLSEMLNLLDGVNIYSGQVIFLTTNTLDKLDPALFRRGRVNYLREVVPLEDEQTKAFIRFLFEDPEVDRYLSSNEAPCYTKVRSADIYGFYGESLGNAKKFFSLMTIYEKPTEEKKVACLNG